MRKVGLMSLLAAGLIAVACVVPTAAAGQKGAQKAKVGEAAPQFSLPDQNGKTVSLADFAGKTVVLEWFNPGCPYVQKFYNSGKMNEIAKQYTGKDVVWLLINTTRGNTAESNKEAARKWSIDRPILSDDGGKVAREYGAKSTPGMYVIDKEGKLVYAGAIDDQPDADPKTLEGAKNYVTAALDELAAGKAVSVPETKSYGCGVKY